MPTAPDLAAVKAYLGTDHSWSDSDISSALAAEIEAQANVVKFPADPEAPAEPLPYSDDLAEALKRRVHRNLSLKALPLGLQSAISEMAVTTTRIGWDAEIKRLEAPHRRLAVG